jgi:hypothetical protein
MLGSPNMNSFRGKLRRFRDTWLAQSEQAPAAARSIASFLFNADDTPRHWPADRPWILPEPDLPPVELPRFRRVAHEVAANDARQRAA